MKKIICLMIGLSCAPLICMNNKITPTITGFEELEGISTPNLNTSNKLPLFVKYPLHKITLSYPPRFKMPTAQSMDQQRPTRRPQPPPEQAPYYYKNLNPFCQLACCLAITGACILDTACCPLVCCATCGDNDTEDLELDPNYDNAACCTTRDILYQLGIPSFWGIPTDIQECRSVNE